MHKSIKGLENIDKVIDLGPEAGEAGGYVVAEGEPSSICKVEESHTGRFLKAVL